MKNLRQIYLFKEGPFPGKKKLGGPGTALKQGDGSTDGSASKPTGPQGSGGTGGMNSSSSGGPVLAMSEENTLDKQKKSEKMQFKEEPAGNNEDKKTKKAKKTVKVTKEQLKKLVSQEVRKHLTEAVDDEPREDWAKFGKKVDDFINDTIEKCDSLFKEGEDILYDKEDDDEGGDDKFRFISSRLGFLKSARNKLAQRFEGLRRED